MPGTNESIQSKPVSLSESNHVCDQLTRKHFRDYRWVVGNLPREQRDQVFALTAYLTRALELMDSQVSAIARRDEWQEWRDQVRDGLRNNFRLPELPAIVDAVNRLEIPREYLFDVQAGVELAIRCKKFEAFDQWMQMASRIGGSMMLAMVHVLGFEKPGFEEAAMACGEAFFLVQLMDEMGNGFHNLMLYAPRMIARNCNVHLEGINPKNPGVEYARFIRSLTARIEPKFEQGGKLVNFMSFDGKRVIRSLVAIHWQMFVKMKQHPEFVLQRRHQLSAKEMLQLRFKHLMGLEGHVPVIHEGSSNHH